MIYKNRKEVEDHLSRYGKDRTYFEIAEQYNFRPHKTRKQRQDDVRGIWRKLKKEDRSIPSFRNINTKYIIPYDSDNTFDSMKSAYLQDANSFTSKEKLTVYEAVEKYGHLEEFQEFLNWQKSKQYDNSIISAEVTTRALPRPYVGNPDNVLVIGDLHEPFCLEGYLEFCREKQQQFDCGTIVFIGDIIDSYYESFYDKAINAPMTQEEERRRAVNKLKEWYSVFPKATVTIGNHTLRYYRKGEKMGIHESHFKPIDKILETPKDWVFTDELQLNNVLYRHGATGHAFINAQKERMSVVEGDKHTLGYVQWSSSRKDSIFGMQTGCGVDSKSFAFNYAKRTPKEAVIGCGVVLDRGQTPLFLKMNT